MSTWIAIILVALALAALTFVLGEWLSRELVSSRMPRPADRDDSRPDPLAGGEDEQP